MAHLGAGLLALSNRHDSTWVDCGASYGQIENESKESYRLGIRLTNIILWYERALLWIWSSVGDSGAFPLRAAISDWMSKGRGIVKGTTLF